MNYDISAPAAHAARVLLQHFEITERSGGRVKATERNLAILIDVCTQVFRLQGAVQKLVTENPWRDKEQLGKNLGRLREAVRVVEIVNNSVPNYDRAGSDFRVIGVKNAHPPELTRKQQEELNLVRDALRKARTVDEEQKVLRAAGLIR